MHEWCRSIFPLRETRTRPCPPIHTHTAHKPNSGQTCDKAKGAKTKQNTSTHHERQNVGPLPAAAAARAGRPAPHRTTDGGEPLRCRPRGPLLPDPSRRGAPDPRREAGPAPPLPPRGYFACRPPTDVWVHWADRTPRRATRARVCGGAAVLSSAAHAAGRRLSVFVARGWRRIKRASVTRPIVPAGAPGWVALDRRGRRETRPGSMDRATFLIC